MTSSEKQSALSKVNSLFEREFKNDHEAHRAYNALWEVNHSLFPDSKAAKKSKANIGEWDESQLSDQFKSDVNTFVDTLETFEEIVKSSKSTKKLSTRASESVLKSVMGRMISNLERQAAKRDKFNDEVAEILSDPMFRGCLLPLDDSHNENDEEKDDRDDGCNAKSSESTDSAGADGGDT